MCFARVGDVDIKIIPTMRNVINKGKNPSSANSIIKTAINVSIIPITKVMLNKVFCFIITKRKIKQPNIISTLYKRD